MQLADGVPHLDQQPSNDHKAELLTPTSQSHALATPHLSSNAPNMSASNDLPQLTQAPNPTISDFDQAQQQNTTHRYHCHDNQDAPTSLPFTKFSSFPIISIVLPFDSDAGTLPKSILKFRI